MSNDDLRLTISAGLSRKEANGWRPIETTWGKLVRKLSEPKRLDVTVSEYHAMTKDERSAKKDVGGFVGGKIANGQRRGGNVLSRCVISLDIDYGEADTWESSELMCDWECLMHTTCSHTPEKPRYRMFFPLKRPVTPDEYEPVARMIAKQIDIDLFDDTTYQPVRLMYWPACPSDGEFRVWRREGPLADPDELLGWYTDWRDRKEWPCSKRTVMDLHERLGKQESPLKKGGPIGAFCRVYDVPAVIDKYLSHVYAPNETDARRYTYIPGSTVDGLKLWGDHGNEDRPPWVFAYSFHSTDPAYLKMLNAFDLVRVHLFGGDEDGGQTRMMDLVRGNPDVQRKFLEMGEEARAAFSDDGRDDTLAREDDDWNELGNAIRLKDSCRAILRWNGSTDWCYWDGAQWRQNAEAEAMMLTMAQTDRMRDEAARRIQIAPQPVDKRKKSTWSEEYERAMAAYAWAIRSRSYNSLSNTLKNARTLLKIDDPDDFDRDPWKLNTPAGIVDLTTGETAPHTPEEMCTMMTTVSPDWDTPAPKWAAFLDRVTGGDKDFQRYLQDVAGMALVGKVYEEGLVIVYGPGGNGKSTLFSVWQTLMGDYAGTIRNEVLMGNKNGNEVSGQNQLRGKRLVITSELEESQPLNNSLLKRLTSRDRISANVKFHEAITFTPTHTLVLHTNHLPRLKSVDGGTVRRIAVCPFNAVIAKGERITDFAGLLVEEEGPQILAWMIEGAKRFYASHMTLIKPAVVEEASREYIEGEDILLQFLNERCIKKPGTKTGAAAFKDAFFEWVGRTGQYCAISRKAFSKEMQLRGIEYVKDMKGTWVMHYAVTDEQADAFTDERL